jgi:ATP-dependent Clp protease ATP-binding subunit ClpA
VIHLQDGQGEEESGAGPAPGRRGPVGGKEGRLLSEVLRRVESIDSRLSTVEQRMGTGPDTSELDQQIAQAHRDKEAAVAAEDYERAAALRDRENQLLADKAARQEEWVTAHLDIPSLNEGLHRLGDEVNRLRGLLRQQGVQSQDGAA